MRGGIAFAEREGGRDPVAGPEGLVCRGRGARGQAGEVVCPVLEAEAMQPPVPRLEEGDDARQIIGAPDAIGHIIAAPRVAQLALRSSAPLASSTTCVRRSGPPRAPRLIASGKRTPWKAMALLLARL